MAQFESQAKKQTADFHGAAIIDQNGREVPITEDMLQKAFKKLQEKSKSPKH